MGEQIINSLVTIVTALIGVAIIAVLVSKNANTSGVLSAGASALATDLTAAVSPVSSGSGLGSFNLTGGAPVSYPAI